MSANNKKQALFEHFCLVDGADLSGQPKVVFSYPNETSWKNPALLSPKQMDAAGVAFSKEEDVFNKNQLEIAKLLEQVPNFCYPGWPMNGTAGFDDFCEDDAVPLENSLRFTFSLQTSFGTRIYGFCLRIFKTGEQKTHQAEENAKERPQDECFCILSKFPWFSMFFNILLVIFGRRNVMPTPELEQKSMNLFLDSLMKTPFPFAGERFCVRSDPLTKSLESEYYFCRPDSHSGSSSHTTNVNLSLLFSKFSLDRIIDIFSCILREKRILVVGNSITQVSDFIHILPSLMYPFEWQHIFIPILPKKLISYVTAPMPFILGIHDTMFEEVLKMPTESIVVVHLDFKELFLKKQNFGPMKNLDCSSDNLNEVLGKVLEPLPLESLPNDQGLYDSLEAIVKKPFFGVKRAETTLRPEVNEQKAMSQAAGGQGKIPNKIKQMLKTGNNGNAQFESLDDVFDTLTVQNKNEQQTQQPPQQKTSSPAEEEDDDKYWFIGDYFDSKSRQTLLTLTEKETSSILDIFLQFFVDIFAPYRLFMKNPKTDGQDIVFAEDAFIYASQNEATKVFLKELKECQHYRQFIQDRIDLMKESGFSSLPNCQFEHKCAEVVPVAYGLALDEAVPPLKNSSNSIQQNYAQIGFQQTTSSSSSSGGAAAIPMAALGMLFGKSKKKSSTNVVNSGPASSAASYSKNNLLTAPVIAPAAQNQQSNRISYTNLMQKRKSLQRNARIPQIDGNSPLSALQIAGAGAMFGNQPSNAARINSRDSFKAVKPQQYHDLLNSVEFDKQKSNNSQNFNQNHNKNVPSDKIAAPQKVPLSKLLDLGDFEQTPGNPSSEIPKNSNPVVPNGLINRKELPLPSQQQIKQQSTTKPLSFEDDIFSVIPQFSKHEKPKTLPPIPPKQQNQAETIVNLPKIETIQSQQQTKQQMPKSPILQDLDDWFMVKSNKSPEQEINTSNSSSKINAAAAGGLYVSNSNSNSANSENSNAVSPPSSNNNHGLNFGGALVIGDNNNNNSRTMQSPTKVPTTTIQSPPGGGNKGGLLLDFD